MIQTQSKCYWSSHRSSPTSNANIWIMSNAKINVKIINVKYLHSVSGSYILKSNWKKE